MHLNTGQQECIKALKLWWADPEDKNFIIEGAPGTGKTFLCQVLAKEIRGVVPLFTAPTNEATRVLAKILPDHTPVTTFSALGLKLKFDKRDPYLAQSGRRKAECNLLIIDEASMVNQVEKSAKGCRPNPDELIDFVLQEQEQEGIKTIWLGDKCQLPPVGRSHSPVFEQSWLTHRLTEVMRHSGEIADLANLVRKELTPDKHLRNLPGINPLITGSGALDAISTVRKHQKGLSAGTTCS